MTATQTYLVNFPVYFSPRLELPAGLTREQVVEHIMEMSSDEFVESIHSDINPHFIASYFGDCDYQIFNEDTDEELE
jgi:hypothetical protein